MAMHWRFADGTEVQLGGKVEGQSKLARTLREQLVLLPEGRAREVPMSAPPADGERLVLSSPYHMDAWCRMWGQQLSVSLTSAPFLPAMHAPADDDADRAPDERPRVY